MSEQQKKEILLDRIAQASNQTLDWENIIQKDTYTLQDIDNFTDIAHKCIVDLVNLKEKIQTYMKENIQK